MDLDYAPGPYPPSPLTELTLQELRTRRSVKWRKYPPDVLPLWVAEMDAPLAPPIRDALDAAIAAGDTGYVHPGELAEAFSEFALARFGWAVDPAACAIVPDVMEGVAAVLERATAPGDGVLINPPVYPPFFSAIASVGRTVVESPLVPDATGRWGLDLGRLDRDLARPDVTAYLLCNPHNPTGTVFGRDELLAVAGLAERHGVRLLVDEIHAPLVYPGTTFTPLLTLAGEADAAAAAVVFTSASKAWNLAGLKCALTVAGPRAPVDAGRLQAQLLFGAGLPGVIASEVAFRSGSPWLDTLLTGLDANRALLSRLLAEALPGIGYRPPDATYLAWLDCRQLPLTEEPARVFLRQGRIAVNPGPTFGDCGRGHVRLNFATSPEILAAGVGRMASAVRERAASAAGE